ncbi:MAG TPA: cytochrome c biogenesis protein CcsA, partial [Candidatus Thermoplasmatota archaeon]|nr:cytochrome c biogenesis protein CcsA [Candidatus Thermoplasmatota archaeon]
MNLLPAFGATVWFAAAAAAGSAAAFAAASAGRGGRILGVRLAAAAGLLAGLGFTLLALLFVAGDMRVQEVFLHSHRSLAWQWRLAGAWTGQEGSFLLWATAMAAVAWGFAVRAARPAAPPSALPTAAVLGAGAAAFLAAAALHAPFDATPAFFLEGRPDGNGMSPSLRSPYMLIHPPMVFAAYAMLAVPAAAGLASLATGRGGWAASSIGWTRAAWGLGTLSMGLGGLWAYTTLGFGGYWAWDPVEVANLLPWLALTALLHVGLHSARHGSYASAGPVLAVLPLTLTLLSTLSTRSGLWVSVHAFTDPTNTFHADPLQRFLAILEAMPSLAFPFGLAVGVTLSALALWCHRTATGAWTAWGRGYPVVLGAFAGVAFLDPRMLAMAAFEAAAWLGRGSAGTGLLLLAAGVTLAAALPTLARPGGAPPRLDLRGLNHAAVLVLGSSLLALFLFHMAVTRALGEPFYLQRLPLFAAPLLLGLLAFLTHGLLRPKAMAALLAAVVAAAVAAYAITPWPVAASLAVLAGAPTLAGLESVRRAATANGPSARRAGDALVAAAALADLAFWLHPPQLPLLGKPGWALHALMAALSTVAFALGMARLAGARGRWTPLLAGALGGYAVAPALAAAGWWLGRGTPRPAGIAWPRLRRSGMHLAHVAVALALLAYALSTGARSTSDATLEPGDEVQVGGVTYRLEEVQSV